MPRILVADDNTNIQKMVALAFEERGIDVVSVGNGEAAVRRIPDLAPDLVLADVFMPVRNGYEVCEFVKKDDRFSHVPVILLVGAFDPLDEKEARRVGADGVLKKPFIPPDPLIAMVTSALEKNPKLAAEMTKAREVPAAPPEPAAPVTEPPVRVEPKPLPEFPEPTAEEAAAIYGFGKGRVNSGEEAPSPREAEQPEEEDFDGSSTTSDWRRNAVNFEVPKELGAFTPGEDFDSAMFPSESEVPPRHVPVADQETAEPIAQESSPAAEPIETTAYAPTEPAVERKTEAEKTESQAPSSVPAIEKIGEAKPTPATEPGAVKPKSSSWLDMFASPSEYGEGSWMSSIFGSKSKAEKPEEKAKEPSAAEETVPALKPVVAVETIPVAKQPEEESPKGHKEAGTAEPFFVDSVPSAPISGTPPKTDSWLAPPPPPVLGSTPEPAHPRPFVISAEPAHDLLSAPADAAAIHKDPELEEPVAPHFKPEPLLVDEEEPKGVSLSPFSGASEQPEPLYEVSVPPAHESSDEIPGEQQSADEALGSSIFAPASATSAVNPEEGRIPTVPPPNREALADIPFLMPPPPAEFEDKANQSQAAPAIDTDAIVARLLEKLEPQLHEVLAQGLLKPLVENLLREELEKKR